MNMIYIVCLLPEFGFLSLNNTNYIDALGAGRYLTILNRDQL